MSKLEWKEVFRPFLEENAIRTKPLWPLLRDCLSGALATRDEGVRLEDALAMRGPPMNEETADRVLARSLKVLCHVFNDVSCATAFLNIQNDTVMANECDNHACDHMDVDESAGDQVAIGIAAVIDAAVLCSRPDSHLCGELRDPNIRTEGLHLLSTLCALPATLLELLSDTSHTSVSDLFTTALSCLSDSNFRISEEAVTLFVRLVTATPRLCEEGKMEEWNAIVMGESIGKELLRFRSGTRQTQIAVVNVAHALVSSSQPDALKQGIRFLQEHNVVDRLIPLFVSTDRLLRFRVLEFVADLSKKHLYHLCFTDRSFSRDNELNMIRGLSEVFQMKKLATGELPSYLISLSADLCRVLETSSEQASSESVSLFLQPAVHYLNRVCFTEEPHGRLTPVSEFPDSCASMALVSVCTRVLEAIAVLIEKGQQHAVALCLPGYQCLAADLLLHPLLISYASLGRTSSSLLKIMYENDLVDRERVLSSLQEVLSQQERPISVLSASAHELSQVLLSMDSLQLDVDNVRGVLQLMLFHPSDRRKEVALSFLLKILPNQLLFNVLATAEPIQVSIRSMYSAADDFLRTAAVAGLAEIGHYYEWAQVWWSGTESGLDDIIIFLLRAFVDDADTVRRSALEVLLNWYTNGYNTDALLAALSSEKHVEALQKGMKCAADDIDWEVKLRFIRITSTLLCDLADCDPSSKKLQVASRVLHITEAPMLLFHLAQDYDRLARQEALLALATIVERWEGQSVSSPSFVRDLLVALRDMDCKQLAEECSKDAVYPDETDLRNVASEIENPPDCY